jgi:hypothetical protein
VKEVTLTPYMEDQSDYQWNYSGDIFLYDTVRTNPGFYMGTIKIIFLFDLTLLLEHKFAEIS